MPQIAPVFGTQSSQSQRDTRTMASIEEAGVSAAPRRHGPLLDRARREKRVLARLKQVIRMMAQLVKPGWTMQ
jgi:hypothetical protein